MPVVAGPRANSLVPRALMDDLLPPRSHPPRSPSDCGGDATHVAGPAAARLGGRPDGTRLVTGGDRFVRLYVLPIEDLMALARGRLTRAWTAEECQKFLRLERCPETNPPTARP